MEHAKNRTRSVVKQKRPPKRGTFAYMGLPESVRSEVEDQTRAIHNLLGKTARNVIQIGLRLQFVRSRIGRGSFQNWLRSEFRWSQPVASNYMAAARVFSPLDCVEQFQPSALFVLARKNVPESARHEAARCARQGEWITKSRAQALVTKHQESQRGPKSRVAQRVRRYVEGLMKGLPEESAADLASELFVIAEELRSRLNKPDE